MREKQNQDWKRFEEFIKANVFHKTTKENVETVLNSFIIDGTKQDRIKVKTEAYLEGFFIVNGKHAIVGTQLFSEIYPLCFTFYNHSIFKIIK